MLLLDEVANYRKFPEELKDMAFHQFEQLGSRSEWRGLVRVSGTWSQTS